jgi:CRISPR/Cas system CSM-associated protein Csm3 (group 7 of RAMP superfamily)
MHKQLVNQCTIHLSLIPQGPILIKSGRQGADPTKADMEFVETYREGEKTIYLPGSSLKGAIRAHAERIARTVEIETSSDSKTYQTSSFTEQLFGTTFLASRIRIEDAYSTTPPVIEERNGVAIDRVLGSAINGALFNYQVCTSGKFATRIHLRNFSLAQLGLLGLVLRDLNDGWFAIGFGKSRGLGIVSVEYHSATVQYPGCVLQGDKVCPLGKKPGAKSWERTSLLGAGEFLGRNNEYQFPYPDKQSTVTAGQRVPIRAEAAPLNFGVQMQWQKEQVENLFVAAVASWKEVVQPQGATK